jgi:hypothetical protein
VREVRQESALGLGGPSSRDTDTNVPQLLDFIHVLIPVGPGRRGDRAAALMISLLLMICV